MGGTADAAHDALPLLRASNLSALGGIAHAFTTRHGGVSPAPYDALNCSINVGDAPENVHNNWRRAARALGRDPRGWRQLQQVHGVGVVDAASVPAEVGLAPEADAQFTTDLTLTLAVLAADCVPLLFAAPDARAVACAHAGWRGTAADVAGSTARTLAQRAGVPVAALWVALGPSIGPCCFAVGPEAAAQLEAARPAQLAADALVTARSGKLFADLWQLNVALLCAAGVPRDQVEVLGACTVCEPRFFSHRRDQGRTGRQAGLIGLA